MKKLLVPVVALILFGGTNTVQAAKHETEKAVAKKKACPKISAKKCSGASVKKCPKAEKTAAPASDKWDFFQLSFWFGFPSSTHDVDVSGLKVGAPLSSGKVTVNGLEAAVICAGTDNINGLQTSLIFTKAKSVDGLQFSIVNLAEEVDGLQLGVFNMAADRAFQVGIFNYIKGSSIPWMPVMNFRF